MQMLLLHLTIAVLGALAQQAPEAVQRVSLASVLRQVLEGGHRHVVITQHLDLTVLRRLTRRIEGRTPQLLVRSSTLSVRGRCAEGQPASNTAVTVVGNYATQTREVAVTGLQPLRSGQCVLIHDINAISFAGLQNQTAWIASLYLLTEHRGITSTVLALDIIGPSHVYFEDVTLHGNRHSGAEDAQGNLLNSRGFVTNSATTKVHFQDCVLAGHTHRVGSSGLVNGGTAAFTSVDFVDEWSEAGGSSNGAVRLARIGAGVLMVESSFQDVFPRAIGRTGGAPGLAYVDAAAALQVAKGIPQAAPQDAPAGLFVLGSDEELVKIKSELAGLGEPMLPVVPPAMTPHTAPPAASPPPPPPPPALKPPLPPPANPWLPPVPPVPPDRLGGGPPSPDNPWWDVRGGSGVILLGLLSLFSALLILLCAVCLVISSRRQERSEETQALTAGTTNSSCVYPALTVAVPAANTVAANSLGTPGSSPANMLAPFNPPLSPGASDWTSSPKATSLVVAPQTTAAVSPTRVGMVVSQPAATAMFSASQQRATPQYPAYPVVWNRTPSRSASAASTASPSSSANVVTDAGAQPGTSRPGIPAGLSATQSWADTWMAHLPSGLDANPDSAADTLANDSPERAANIPASAAAPPPHHSAQASAQPPLNSGPTSHSGSNSASASVSQPSGRAPRPGVANGYAMAHLAAADDTTPEAGRRKNGISSAARLGSRASTSEAAAVNGGQEPAAPRDDALPPDAFAADLAQRLQKWVGSPEVHHVTAEQQAGAAGARTTSGKGKQAPTGVELPLLARRVQATAVTGRHDRPDQASLTAAGSFALKDNMVSGAGVGAEQDEASGSVYVPAGFPSYDSELGSFHGAFRTKPWLESRQSSDAATGPERGETPSLGEPLASIATPDRTPRLADGQPPAPAQSQEASASGLVRSGDATQSARDEPAAQPLSNAKRAVTRSRRQGQGSPASTATTWQEMNLFSEVNTHFTASATDSAASLAAAALKLAPLTGYGSTPPAAAAATPGPFSQLNARSPGSQTNAANGSKSEGDSEGWRRARAIVALPQADPVVVQPTRAMRKTRFAELHAALDEMVVAGDKLFGKYTVMDSSERRQGGQGLVQFVHYLRNEYAVKFFIRPSAFEQEAHVMQDDDLKQVMFSSCEVRANADGAWKSPGGFVFPPSIITERGQSLNEWLATTQPARPTVVDAMANVAQRLAMLHGCGYAHRDIKPDNLVRLQRQWGWALIDFGCVAFIGCEAPLSFTWKYAAPETIKAYEAKQTSVKASAAVDIWALGIIFFEMLTQQQVFQPDDSRDWVVSCLAGRNPLPWEDEEKRHELLRSLQNAKLRDLVLGCLERSPSMRPSASRFQSTLLQLF